MAPNVPQQGQSEISPLLPKPDRDSNEINTQNGLSYEVAQSGSPDGGDLERQITNGDSSKHQGMPEVKERMKFIFPAIAIGVGNSCLLCFPQ